MYQRHKDTMLLEEAYKATQLTQHLPNLTLKQIQLVVENASAAELEVIEEFLGGIKNVARGAKEGAQRVGQAVGGAARGAGRAVGGAARGAGQAVGQAARGAGQAVGQAARGGVEAVKAGAQQVGQNVKDMYQSGEDEAAAGKRKKQLQDHLTQLEQLFTQHIEASPSSRLKGQNLNDLTLGQLKQALAGTAGVKERKATAARDKGVFGGAGGAAKAGYQQGAAPAPAPAPAGGAAPAPA